MNPGYFTQFVKERQAEGRLIVQPRMGFGGLEEMRAGLERVKQCGVPVIGTITIDSFTRVNRYEDAAYALRDGHHLNGFPLITHGAQATAAMLEGLQGPGFPVQVRHGTALPQALFRALLDSGIDATEGGPVSYCLPYSRVPLRQAIAAWAECCEMLAERSGRGMVCHLESFAGCMLGQLCPPSLLVALGILEGLFFAAHGVCSLSLSFAQGTSLVQDIAALRVLRRLAEEFLPSDIDWHIVVYCFMGLFPRTLEGAQALLRESARLAKIGGAGRLIVKTPAEAHRIPTVEENLDSLRLAYDVSENASYLFDQTEANTLFAEIYDHARLLTEATLELHTGIGEAIHQAFITGRLDVPYCLHRDNANRSRSIIDPRGYLQWASFGGMPHRATRASGPGGAQHAVGSAALLEMLSFNQRKYDAPPRPTACE
ncbi:hypothetical protein [Archangium sp.]|uniref:hypothetical protein n=1 Tax=Archangium sp. TaxID=1872627 RepID=UPI002D4481ED|nr:hypothetical protein [Archangium sp.]HYO55765.1 hypothetical protein [Archangium sp.]